jgi:hypothetical protein
MSHDQQYAEPPGVRTRSIILVVGVTLLLLVAIGMGLELAFPDRIGRTHVAEHVFPDPAVVADEGRERQLLEAQQRRELAGSAQRMSIDEAMAAIAAKGSDAFDPVGHAP